MKRFLCSLISGIALIVLCQYSSNAQIIYVSPNGSGLMDGSSWANTLAGNDTAGNGYTVLADTMRNAGSGTQFWIKAGTYKPSYDNDRNKSFEITENVSIYGGFEGNESSVSERNWEANETVFSGNIGVDSLETDNSFHMAATLMYPAN